MSAYHHTESKKKLIVVGINATKNADNDAMFLGDEFVFTQTKVCRNGLER